MKAESRYEITLAKEDFKFSAAHFTLFERDEAELLHGHNYRVVVAVAGPELNAEGLLFAIAPFKRAIRAACARLDERTLVPVNSRRLTVRSDDSTVEVTLGRRVYRLPRQDVRLLPLRNTSIELLARLLWEELAPDLLETKASRLAVTVEETPGQRCRYAAPL